MKKTGYTGRTWNIYRRGAFSKTIPYKNDSIVRRTE
jgi:hypothetical protein